MASGERPAVHRSTAWAAEVLVGLGILCIIAIPGGLLGVILSSQDVNPLRVVLGSVGFSAAGAGSLALAYSLRTKRVWARWLSLAYLLAISGLAALTAVMALFDFSGVRERPIFLVWFASAVCLVCLSAVLQLASPACAQDFQGSDA